jgi:hypothetical protein
MIKFFSYLGSALRSVHGSWATHGDFGEWLVAKGVVHLVLPVSFYPRENVFLGNVLDLHDVVILSVVLVDNALDLVLCTSQPTLLDVFENDLQAGLWASDVARVGDGDAERPCAMSVQHDKRLRAYAYLVGGRPGTLLDESTGTLRCPCSST